MNDSPERRRHAAGGVVAALGVLLVLTGAPVQADAGTRPPRPASNLTVSVEGGLIAGTRDQDVVAFKGIPYAAPPVGALRWRAPQPVPAWSGVRSADRYGADCMQLGDAPGPWGVTTTPAEDCLYLNLWKPPVPATAKLPVMVWIYGGGFLTGGSSKPVFDGSAFARDGIVLVSFNYRLGNFGFFAHPALSTEQKEGPQVNYGVMDQIAALKWVQRNISRFGGDPGNVTIFGESAGGGSVHMLLTSPLAAGLFQKAIIESGGGRAGLLDLWVAHTLPQVEEWGLAIARSHGIEGEGAESLARLRELPAATLLEGLNMVANEGTFLDGQLCVGTPVDLYAAGKGARVPVMVGATSADVGWLPWARTLDALYAVFGPNGVEARKVYPGTDAEAPAVIAAAAADELMVEPARKVAQVLSARGQRVYEFRFSYVATSQLKGMSGAQHASEIPYVFDTVAAVFGKDTTAADEATARAMHAAWVAFARTGEPNGPGLPAWPAYDTAQDELMNFTQAGPVAGTDPWKARLDLAQRLNERKGPSVDVAH